MQAVGKKNRTSLHSLYDFVLMTRGILCIGTGGPTYKRTRGLLCVGISSRFAEYRRLEIHPDDPICRAVDVEPIQVELEISRTVIELGAVDLLILAVSIFLAGKTVHPTAMLSSPTVEDGELPDEGRCAVPPAGILECDVLAGPMGVQRHHRKGRQVTSREPPVPVIDDGVLNPVLRRVFLVVVELHRPDVNLVVVSHLQF